MTEFTIPASIDYTDGVGEAPTDYPSLTAKFEKAAEVVDRALDTYDNTAVMWTGGKDSTLVLYVVMEVAREKGLDVPPVVFIDHFEHFDETIEFVEHWANEWDLDLVIARNEALEPFAPGEEVPLATLDEQTRHELDRVGHEGESLVVDADSLAGNHLLKTVALNDTLVEHGFEAVFSGVRWDEQDARTDETFFSPRHESEKYPPHDRVHPILQFEERDVWDAFWGFIVPDTVDGYPTAHVPQDMDDLAGFEPEDLPVSPKYFEGFRSLGTESGSGDGDDQPAWLQDLDSTTERAGRAQDKEGVMAHLRDLGYM